MTCTTRGNFGEAPRPDAGAVAKGYADRGRATTGHPPADPRGRGVSPNAYASRAWSLAEAAWVEAAERAHEGGYAVAGVEFESLTVERLLEDVAEGQLGDDSFGDYDADAGLIVQRFGSVVVFGHGLLGHPQGWTRGFVFLTPEQASGVVQGFRDALLGLFAERLKQEAGLSQNAADAAARAAFHFHAAP